jgi:hypothetical protein
MTWVFGNLLKCRPAEIFAAQLQTPAPITGFRYLVMTATAGVEPDLEVVESLVPRTLEAWVYAQQKDEHFEALLQEIDDRATRQDLWIRAPATEHSTIIVPLTCQELLVRDTHQRMFHLSHAKVFAMLHFWPTLKRDVWKWLADCPECELNKARQNTAHGLFSAHPSHAPRAKWCMDFQGQGTALTGETEALALIDPISRYVVIIPLMDREAATWIQPFLDRVVFTFGPPDVLHSDAAPEFLSEALACFASCGH